MQCAHAPEILRFPEIGTERGAVSSAHLTKRERDRAEASPDERVLCVRVCVCVLLALHRTLCAYPAPELPETESERDSWREKEVPRNRLVRERERDR